MEIFEALADRKHEQLVFWGEPDVGYRGVIAIHDTTLGPALGGTRFWNYQNEHDAIIDALRLSRGMTYKAAVTGLELGGGKSVIWGDSKTLDREQIFRAHGRAVDSLGGRYITAEDVGTSPDDMAFVNMETQHVAGLLGRSGDPSPVTAFGVYNGIRACAAATYGDGSLADRHVVVQGLGHVGYYLCEDLAQEGARLTVTDIDEPRIQRVVDDFGAEPVSPEDVYAVDADIFAPCALGAVINDRTVEALRVDIVAGAANNQLEKGSVHGPALHERGILYAPDYVINAGGLINVYGELHGWSPERSKEEAAGIHDTLLRIFEHALAEGVPPHVAANQVALARLEAARGRKGTDAS